MQFLTLLKFWKEGLVALLVAFVIYQHLIITHKHNVIEKQKIKISQLDKKVDEYRIKYLAAQDAIIIQNKAIDKLAETSNMAQKKIDKFKSTITKSKKKFKKELTEILSDKEIKTCNDGIKFLIDSADKELKW